jgi:DNA (cytosine-5)-methyltransferase 1
MSNAASPKPTFLDFFCGSGLVTEALREMFVPVWSNDNSEMKAAVYRVNHGSDYFDARSITDIRGNQVPQAKLSWASFPCQDLSLAGNLDGLKGARSGLVWEWLRVMREMRSRRPPILVIENVTGFVSAERGTNYREVHRALNLLGYKCGVMMLDAARWVPQSRPRIFMVCVPKGWELGPLEDTGPNWLHPDLVLKASKDLPLQVWWKIPVPPPRRTCLNDIIDWEAEHDDEERTRRNLALISEKHRAKLLIELANGFRAAPAYKRTRGRQVLELRFDGIAGCLRTPEGGSSRQFLVLKKDGRLVTRLITIKEAARLMGAPSRYKLPRNYNDAYWALGDAVAVPVVQYLAQHLLAPLAETAGRHRE